MEERVPPATPDDRNHHHRSNDDQEEEFDDHYDIDHVKNVAKNDNNDEMQIVSSTRDDKSNNQPHATYIIQIPKDQIYRVPPPENAEIVERYRNPVQTNQRGRRRCVYWFLSIFFVVAFLVSFIVCVHHFTLKPKNPTFSVKHLGIKHPAPSSKKKASPDLFQVSVETTNPNNVNDIGYEQGSATLTYKGKKIGYGSFPALENEQSGKIDAVELVLAESTSKGGLPKELQSQSHNKKPLNLNLSMSIPLKKKTWLYTQKVDVEVGCEFEVNSFGDNMKVLSQKCDIQK